MDRTQATLLSLTSTIILNMLAGVLTLVYMNGTTIVETNPFSSALLRDVGAGALFVHALAIAAMYPLAYMVSRAISSRRLLFRAKRIYLFTFTLLITLLPAGAFVDLLSDVLVILWGFDSLVGPQKIVAIALLFACYSAVVQTRRKWTLPQTASR